MENCQFRRFFLLKGFNIFNLPYRQGFSYQSKQKRDQQRTAQICFICFLLAFQKLCKFCWSNSMTLEWKVRKSEFHKREYHMLTLVRNSNLEYHKLEGLPVEGDIKFPMVTFACDRKFWSKMWQTICHKPVSVPYSKITHKNKYKLYHHYSGNVDQRYRLYRIASGQKLLKSNIF